MQCVICKQGETRPGMTTVTVERNGLTLVIKNVPARVCDGVTITRSHLGEKNHYLRTGQFR